MATTYRAKALVVKVSLGPANGNRVARIIKQGGIIPEGVEKDQLTRLEELGLIEKVPAEPDESKQSSSDSDPEAEAKAAAEAEAKAAAEAEAKAAAARKPVNAK